jgi:hypothetical protein
MVVNKNSIKNSFRLVKTDIIKIEGELMNIKTQIAKIFQELDYIKQKSGRSEKITNKKMNYIASKTGKNFHINTCALAKNIKPKNKIFFNSKDEALDKNYKPCICVK